MQSNKRARTEEQKHLFKNPNHFVDLNNARLSGHLCDVTIKVNDKEFQAHKIILAMNLKYFKTMFLNAFQESKQDVITMQDVRESDLEALITYAYTGEILITENNVLSLFEVANYLTEDNIKEACVEFLKIHLKKENACIAYKLANSTECLALKNITRKIILSNFENCSLTAQYLSMDFESLKDILSYNSKECVQSQQIFFEGIVRWILHDTRRRKLHVNDLLDTIEIHKLGTDYLLPYFCEWIEDQSDIVKDIMSFYRTKSQLIQQDKNKESLIVIGDINRNVCVQLYDFTEKKWTPSRLVKNRGFERGVIFNNVLYYTTYDWPTTVGFQIFNPTTMQSTTLASNCILIRCSGICACTKKLYFCGGRTVSGSASDQVLSYDVQTDSFETLPRMNVKRWSPAVISYEGNLFVFGGSNGSSALNSVERYDPKIKIWTTLASMGERRYGNTVAMMDGKVYAGRGLQTRDVEVYDLLNNSWKLIASMNKNRSSFLLVTYKGKLLAIGGDRENTVEVYDPIKDHWQMDVEMSSGLQINYPRGGIIPTSCVSKNI